MNKTELVEQVATDTGLNKTQAGEAVNAVLNAIQGALKKDDSVVLVGFGTFSVTERASRTGRNPRTGQEITIPEVRIPRFKPGKVLKDAVVREKVTPPPAKPAPAPVPAKAAKPAPAPVPTPAPAPAVPAKPVAKSKESKSKK